MNALIDRFNELESKQKITLVITIILFIVVLYYGYDTFFGGSDYSSPVAPVKQKQVAVKTSTTKQPSSVSDNSSTNTAPTTKISLEQQPGENKPANTSVTKVAPAEITPEEKAMIAENQQLQKQYLYLVNKYQMAQLQEKLESTNASIAASKLKAVSTMVKTQEISKELKRQQAAPIQAASPSEASKAEQISNVSVAYVGKRRGKWIAMLKLDDAYFEVRIGTHLPDGAVIDLINEQGVVLDKKGDKKYMKVPRSLD